jgi:RNA chaperone Hfq
MDGPQPVVLLHSAELIKFRDERRTIVFTLTGGEKIEGAIRWFDEMAIHITLADRNELTIFKHAILYYQGA